MLTVSNQTLTIPVAATASVKKASRSLIPEFVVTEPVSEVAPAVTVADGASLVFLTNDATKAFW